jgi:ribosomal protein S18 acetylase RimI-like enzyme
MVLELLGYVASVIIALSLMMSSLLRLRLVNLAGALLFAIYGVAIGALPVAAVNGFIVVINIWHLSRMLRTREYFRVLEVSPHSEYLRYFVQQSDADIRRFLPGFELQPDRTDLACFVLRDLVPAGLFLAQRQPDGSLRVLLDYVLPNYRDLKVGRYLLHEQAAFFLARDVRRVVSERGHRAHARYLRTMGFRELPDGLMELRLA